MAKRSPCKKDDRREKKGPGGAQKILRESGGKMIELELNVRPHLGEEDVRAKQKRNDLDRFGGRERFSAEERK